MAALVSGSTTSPRALELKLKLHRSGRFSDKASSSGGAESSAVAVEGGCEAKQGVVDLDSP
jgi:E3 ubiquitin-protein ligase RNF14